MTLARTSYNEALKHLHEAFKNEPEKGTALLGVLTVLVDRIGDLEREVASARQEASAAGQAARMAQPPRPLRG